MKKAWVLLLSMAMMASLAACSTNKSGGTTPPATTGTLKAGSYVAAKEGMNGPIEVKVTVDEKSILSVEVTSNSETPGIGDVLMDGKSECEIPVSAIPQRIVETQSVTVDMITGATITSAAISSAVKDCLQQAGGKVEDWSKKPDVAEGEKREESADVIVVGGGGAGLAAAISASENGSKVIIIEKNGAVGGDTLVCGAIYNNPDPELQSKVEMSDAVKSTVEAALKVEPKDANHKALIGEVKKEWEAYKASGSKTLFDSDSWFALQTYNGGDMVANLDLVKVLTYQATDGYNWIKGLGMGFSDKIAQGAGSLWQRTHTSTKQMGTGFISTYMENIIKDKNIKLMTSTTGTKLILNDAGAVVGVEAMDLQGNTYKLNATKGVVLATGGFAANSKMIEEYNTSGKWDATDLTKVMTTNRFSSSQGDGIKMAIDAGADLTDMDQIQLLYLSNVINGGLTKYPPRCVNGTSQVIFINKEGQRFVREDGRRDEICLKVLAQTDSMFYFLESADGDYTDVDTAMTADGFSLRDMEKQGYVIIADTLEEMATKLSCDVETLKATVASFNESVDSGKDENGRTLYANKLEKGPWVATPRTAGLHHTMGGVTIDTETHVLDANGKIITGLVAAGEVTGGLHGGNRLGGNAVVDTVVFGRLAGQTISK